MKGDSKTIDKAMTALKGNGLVLKILEEFQATCYAQ